MNIIKLLIDTQALILPGILLALVVVSLVFNISKKSKYQRETQDLEDNLQVGDKVKTYAGIYGVVESIREALDGSKVVLIKSGEGDKVSYYSMDIAAIYSLDFKDEEEKEDEDNDDKEVEEKVSPKDEEVKEVVEELQEEPKEKVNEEVQELIEQPVEVEDNKVEEVIEEVKKPKTTKKTTSSTKKTTTTKKTATTSKTKKDK